MKICTTISIAGFLAFGLLIDAAPAGAQALDGTEDNVPRFAQSLVEPSAP